MLRMILQNQNNSHNNHFEMFKLTLVAFLVFAALASQIGQQKTLAVTIYNNDFAMVKDVRSISFDQGQSFLYFNDVSANIQTETVTFKALKNPESIRVFEQNFQRNLVNKGAILKRYIQKEIDIYVDFGDKTKRVKGTLLGYDDGYIMQTQFGVNIFNKISGIEFPSLPSGFFTTPTLNWKVASTQAQTVDCEVAYRTTGFSWKADYSITLNGKQTKADVGGWVTINNNSGKKYTNAKIKLIAGQVNKVNVGGRAYNDGLLYARSQAVALSAPSFQQKSFADYHLYTLSEPATLTQASQKQIEFIPKVYGVGLRKYHLININPGGYTRENLGVNNKIHFQNTAAHGLGIPFPKGIVRVFKQDQADGSLEFIGQDRIEHTPKNENITITTGKAFDIVAHLYAESRSTNVNSQGYTANMNLTITNHKETEADIEIELANYYGSNLEVTWQTKEVLLQKQNANLFKFSRKFKPDQTFAFEWLEKYNP